MNDALIAAWVAWDRRPSNDQYVARKEQELKAAGIRGCWFHDEVARERRNVGLKQALERVLERSG